ERHRPIEFSHCVAYPCHAPEQRDSVCLPRLEDTFEREKKATAGLSRGPLPEVGETFRVASSRHQAPGKRHDRGNVRLWPADRLLPRIQLEVGHDQLLGGHRARTADEPDADGDREHACEPVHGTHFTSSHHGGYTGPMST